MILISASTICTQSWSSLNLPWQLIFPNLWNFFTASLSKTQQTWHFSQCFTKHNLFHGPSGMSGCCLISSPNCCGTRQCYHSVERSSIFELRWLYSVSTAAVGEDSGHRKPRSGQDNLVTQCKASVSSPPHSTSRPSCPEQQWSGKYNFYFLHFL